MAERHDSLAALFRELAQLTVLEEGSPNAFRVRAYENALEAISSFRGDLSALSEKQLTAIDGIGQSTARKIREFFEGGTIAKLEDLRRKYPADFVELGTIPGLGPKTLLRLRDELGVRNLQDLRAALESQKVRGVRGLGAKMEEKLLHAIERMGATGKDKRRPIAQAMPIAQEIVAALAALPAAERVQCCGSLRRLRETVADVDVVVASRDAASVREAFVSMPAVREVMGSGETKTSVLTSTGLQVDLRIVDPGQFGAACQYFTGSKTHNIKLRQRALARGWLLNEYGLSDAETGAVIAAESEEAIYGALGLPLIPPPMREDRGEIEEAEAGRLPPAVRFEDVRGDLHVHTTLSGDGRSPLRDVVESAARRGYEYLAVTDHAENLAMSGVSRERLAAQRAEIDRLRGSFSGLALLHGSELNVGRDGRVDYDEGFRRTLDWCVAGVHSHFDLDRAEQTRRILAAMEDPTVDAIAHLSGRRIGHRAGIDLDLDAVLRKAVETNTAIEINAALGRLDASSETLLRARGMDVTFVISTDTHHTRELARMEWGALLATRGRVEPSRIANLWPRERFLGWLRARRRSLDAAR
ncbi:MAG TPA: DNA polymerase/3'-5' exonuclease PolX [Vicinamibacteria bacterium]|nr:DNA polymerase/3'-5' exonuclease PolX [Vicinamibacteria bacterium]